MTNRLGATVIVALAAAGASRPAAAATAYAGTVLSALPGPTGSTSPTVNAVAAGPAVGSATVGNGSHALWWTGVGGRVVDLNPVSLAVVTSIATGVAAGQQVGSETVAGAAGPRATLWAGSAASAVDLSPTALPRFNASFAAATDGVHQVGGGYNASNASATGHALLWAGTAASAVDLHPAQLGFSTSAAQAVSRKQQVGYGQASSTDQGHAVLWTGTAASAVDLNPTTIAGFTYSRAFGLGGNQQVGSAEKLPTGDGFNNVAQEHAVVWTGTAASAIDLNPTGLAGIADTRALSTNGSVQVGFGGADGTYAAPHALLWTGTAASAVDLHATLPVTGAWTQSRAFTVNPAGDAFGLATGSLYGVAGTYAIEWLPVTVPATFVPAGQSYHFATGPAGGGITVRAAAGVSLDGTVKLDPSLAPADRQLLVAAGYGLMLAGTTSAWTATVDVGDNDLDLPGASLATVTNQIAEGFANGKWNGTGITSGTAAADARHLTGVGIVQNVAADGVTPLYPAFDGQPVTAADVLLRYTYYGDANLDGVVNAADYTRLDAGYIQHLSGWANGDFNYDGVVDGSDYALADNAFNQQAGGIAAPAAVTAVPEPVGVGGLAVVATAAVARRRRRSTRPPPLGCKQRVRAQRRS